MTGEGGGLLTGRVGTSLGPQVGRVFDDGVTHSFSIGPLGIVDNQAGLRRYQLGTAASLGPIWTPAQDNGLFQDAVTHAPDAIFWSAGGLAYPRQRVYTPQAGVAVLRGYGNDTTRGVGSIGTDGTWLVWLEGTERTGRASDGYPKVTAFVAPYTTDPTALAPRVLRDDLGGANFGTRPFVVGCGYAALSSELRVNGVLQYGITVIRLSDGVAWQLPTAINGAALPWSWERPLAITCDELFAIVAPPPTRPEVNVARRTLASLGPGLPPP
jgi:hypothetical protein